MRPLSFPLPRRSSVAVLTCVALGAGGAALVTASPANSVVVAPSTPGLKLLTDPFLQLPTSDSVRVVWMTEFPGDDHVVIVGEQAGKLSAAQAEAAAASGRVDGGAKIVTAASMKLSQVGEDAGSQLPADRKPTAEQGIVDRQIWRHEAKITGLKPGEKVPYRVVSTDGSAFASSGTFELSATPKPGSRQRILITSDHQAMINTPANLEMAAKTIGDIDAVFLAGDLVNIPDRASEWFDDQRGSAFFPVLQGRGGRGSTHGEVYNGGQIIQSAPLFPAVGNHEVQGQRAGFTGLNASFNAPVPKAIAERAYAAVIDQVNPTRDPKIKARWIEDRSFSTKTYREIFSLPEDSPGGEDYYAASVGDVRLISLYSTRIWRGTTANTAPADRTAQSRYQESKTTLGDPLAQGYGEHIFEAIDEGSEQLRWLEQELKSEEFKKARVRVVMLHEGPQGLGDNVMPVFTNPVRTEEKNAAGQLEGVRYEYPATENHLVRDLQPMLDEAGVDLVHNGHSHLWNRFQSASGTNFLETSNTGNTYGAFHPLSGRTRPLPPTPWITANYLAQGNPGGLAPIVPTEAPVYAPNGQPQPFVQSNDHNVFTVLDTGTNEVISYIYDLRTPTIAPKLLDRFSLGRPVVDPKPDPVAPGVSDPAGDAPLSAGPADAPVPAGDVAGEAVASTTTASAGVTTFGQAANVQVSVASAVAPSGLVVVSRAGRALASGRVEAGSGKVVLQGTALPAGKHLLTVRYTGGGRVAPSTATTRLTVRTATPSLTASLPAGAAVRSNSKPALKVGVSAPGLRPAGRVTVTAGGKRVASGNVRAGRATLRLSRLQKGRTTLRVRFHGAKGLKARTVSVKLTVR